MATTFLRFADEATFQAAAEAAGMYSPYVPYSPATDDEPEQSEQPASYNCYCHHHAMDIIGTIYTPGTYDDDGNELTPPVALPGWHVNYKGVLPDGWASSVVTPVTPYRVFAGD